MNGKNLLIAASTLLVLYGDGSASDIYRCADEHGAITFSDAPCGNGATVQHVEPNSAGRLTPNAPGQAKLDQQRAEIEEEFRQAREKVAVACMKGDYEHWRRSEGANATPDAQVAKWNEMLDACNHALEARHPSRTENRVAATQTEAAKSPKQLGSASPADPPATASQPVLSPPPPILGTRNLTLTIAVTTPSAPATPLEAGDVDREFEKFPTDSLLGISQLPASAPLILEARTETQAKRGYHPGRNRIVIFEPAKHRELRWEIENDVFGRLAPNGPQRATWSPARGQLLYGSQSKAVLFDRNGMAREISLLLPGHVNDLEGVEAYSLSPDGRSLAYILYTRDSLDKQTDPAGKLYRDLLLQDMDGTRLEDLRREIDGRPQSVTWNSKGDRIAYATMSGTIEIIDRNGVRHLSITPSEKVPRKSANTLSQMVEGSIHSMAWDPSGERLAFSMGQHLYAMNADGTDIGRVRLRTRGMLGEHEISDKDAEILSFAWSPDGRQFVLRSTYDSPQRCDYSALGTKIQRGSFPCDRGSRLFTSRVDGSAFEAISDVEYVFLSQLFWIQ